MDSSSSGAEGLPPALPAKQRRSLYSRSYSTSSVERKSRSISMVFPSPLPSPDLTSGSVSLPTSPSCDCFAPQCPIHHRYEHSDCHQERYFSENTPPPVPKKRLARTMSLPEGFPGSSYTRPTHLPQFNPLSRLSPLEDAVFEPGCSVEEEASEAQLDILSPPQLPQLGFDTPDEQLPCFFSNLGHQAQVSEKLQQRLLLFLRSTVEKIEKGVGTAGASLGQIQPQDLMLCQDDLFLNAQDGVQHYRVRCPSLHGQEFDIKVSTESGNAISPLLQYPHANVQQMLSHFSGVSVKALLLAPEREIGTLAPDWPQGGSSQAEMQREPSVLSLLKQDYHVTVSRDVTQGDLEQFVLEGRALHSSHPEVYHRRLALLLLQVTQALLHLQTHGIQVADLDPHSIRLSWAENDSGRLKLKTRGIEEPQESSEGVNKRKNNCERKNTVEKQKNELLGNLENLWMTWGTPRVVLTLLSPSTTKPSQPVTSHQIQLGRLLQHCLHLPETQKSCTNSLPNSPYSEGLLCLLSQLIVPEHQLQMTDTVPFLQALLWGPRASLFQHSLPDPTTVHNWLLVKRSLLLLKLAERGLFSDQSSADWEDYLCLQYFSLTDPHTVLNATAKLGLHHSEI
ncbi:inactive tyrosine-protein kinase PRAG1 [Sardina pilchardus]|uniref:inactive tyrosine-protein kinase PRAG1 n=1 Tax=Sardina pilchardus TaxID=27697 RepID=UPI002E0EAF51